jgi:hypothetical protein
MGIDEVKGRTRAVQPVAPTAAGGDAKTKSEQDAEAARQLPKPLPPRRKAKKPPEPKLGENAAGEGHLDTLA